MVGVAADLGIAGQWVVGVGDAVVVGVAVAGVTEPVLVGVGAVAGGGHVGGRSEGVDAEGAVVAGVVVGIAADLGIAGQWVAGVGDAVVVVVGVAGVTESVVVGVGAVVGGGETLTSRTVIAAIVLDVGASAGVQRGNIGFVRDAIIVSVEVPKITATVGVRVQPIGLGVYVGERAKAVGAYCAVIALVIIRVPATFGVVDSRVEGIDDGVVVVVLVSEVAESVVVGVGAVVVRGHVGSGTEAVDTDRAVIAAIVVVVSANERVVEDRIQFIEDAIAVQVGLDTVRVTIGVRIGELVNETPIAIRVDEVTALNSSAVDAGVGVGTVVAVADSLRVQVAIMVPVTPRPKEVTIQDPVVCQGGTGPREDVDIGGEQQIFFGRKEDLLGSLSRQQGQGVRARGDGAGPGVADQIDACCEGVLVHHVGGLATSILETTGTQESALRAQTGEDAVEGVDVLGQDQGRVAHQDSHATGFQEAVECGGLIRSEG